MKAYVQYYETKLNGLLGEALGSDSYKPLDARLSLRNMVLEAEKLNFKGNNTAGINIGDIYVVYSYGRHWPLFVYDGKNGQWYENAEKYSVSTSKHASQLRPLHVNIDKVSRELLRSVFAV